MSMAHWRSYCCYRVDFPKGKLRISGKARAGSASVVRSWCAAAGKVRAWTFGTVLDLEKTRIRTRKI